MLKCKNYFNIKWLLIAVGFTAVVVLLTHIPQEVMPPPLQVIGLDKLAHALAYGGITYLFILSLRPSPTLLSALVLFFTILAVGAIDELTQPLNHFQYGGRPKQKTKPSYMKINCCL
jgi:hypothetical protein